MPITEDQRNEMIQRMEVLYSNSTGNGHNTMGFWGFGVREDEKARLKTKGKGCLSCKILQAGRRALIRVLQQPITLTKSHAIKGLNPRVSNVTLHVSGPHATARVLLLYIVFQNCRLMQIYLSTYTI